MLIAVVGGYVALRLTGSLSWVFIALAAGMFIYGVTLALAIGRGAWFKGQSA
jgi:hypothetical protein